MVQLSTVLLPYVHPVCTGKLLDVPCYSGQYFQKYDHLKIKTTYNGPKGGRICEVLLYMYAYIYVYVCIYVYVYVCVCAFQIAVL